MKILAVDDEPLSLNALDKAIRTACPQSILKSFLNTEELLAAARTDSFDIAFLDIRLLDVSGIAVAKTLKDLNPRINIIFVTGYSEYTADAMSMHASGYILKPVTPEKVSAELADLRHPIRPMNDSLLRIRCFGNFDVFTPAGQILSFDRSLSKEAFAYLVYKRGTSCSIREIAAVLFEDAEYDQKQKGYIQKILSSMISTLRSVNAGAVIHKKYNSISLDTTKVDCDYYRFQKKDVAAINSYSGEFMSQYAWAEFAIGYLDNLLTNSY